MSGPIIALAAGLGAGDGHDQPPGLVDASLQIVANVEGTIAAERDAPIVAGLSIAMALGSYDNTQPPPSLVTLPSDRIDVRRVGIGLVVEGRLPVGSALQLAAGAGPYVVHTEATASGLLAGPIPLPADYYSADDTGLGGALRVGFEVRVAPRATLGMRGGYFWYTAELGAAGGGSLGGLWLDARVSVEFDTR